MKPTTRAADLTVAPRPMRWQTTVSRIWRDFGLALRRADLFKLSTDPFFVDKVHDVVGLYLDPPERALVAVRG
ncbi:hypothetical protein ABH935_009964 [Catenulispora sp. GAS73]